MDQSGNAYTIQVIDCKGTNASQKPCGAAIDELPDNKTPITVYVAINAKCSDTQGKAEVGDTRRAFAVIGPLETGIFCQNAQ